MGLFFKRKKSAGDPATIPAIEPDLPEWIWCLVANVKGRETKGYDGRGGTKHFAPGTRVYVYLPRWSWDGAYPVVGKKKGTHQLIRKVMCEADLENFRVKRVYSPTIISWMVGKRSERILNYSDKEKRFGDCFKGWGNTPEDRKEIEQLARWLNEEDEKCKGRDPA